MKNFVLIILASLITLTAGFSQNNRDTDFGVFAGIGGSSVEISANVSTPLSKDLGAFLRYPKMQYTLGVSFNSFEGDVLGLSTEANFFGITPMVGYRVTDNLVTSVGIMMFKMDSKVENPFSYAPISIGVQSQAFVMRLDLHGKRFGVYSTITGGVGYANILAGVSLQLSK